MMTSGHQQEQKGRRYHTQRTGAMSGQYNINNLLSFNPFYPQQQQQRRALSTTATTNLSSSDYDHQQHNRVKKSSSPSNTSTTTTTTTSSSSSLWIQNEINRYGAQDPIERAFTPPSSWYTEDVMLQHEKDYVFLCNNNNNNKTGVYSGGSSGNSHNMNSVDGIDGGTVSGTTTTTNNKNNNNRNHNNWVAVDSGVGWEGGSFQTGQFLGQPYLLTRPVDYGPLQAFYNICTHGGSCLVGPWTNTTTSSSSSSSTEDGDNAVTTSDSSSSGPTSSSSSLCRRLGPDLVGKSVQGILPTTTTTKSKKKKRRGGTFACPYHGWEFDVDGRLVKATHVTGIEDFKNKDYGLKPIAVREIGPMVFLNFGTTVDHETMDNNWRLLSDRLEESGFERDLSTLRLVAKEEYTVRCNWKIFVDNYGDGCYHCGYAHADLASNIDESAYSTDIMSSELSIQNAPPLTASSSSSEVEGPCDVRFGNKRAVYAQWYPNVMFNRYGPWFDVDIVIPIDAGTCQIRKAWYIERDFVIPSNTYIEDCLKSSRQVHDEDVFLCENVQLGLSSRGYDRGRYVPTKQIAAHMFHRRLARDLQL